MNMILINKVLVFFSIFIIGELVFNFTWFKYLKNYFEKSVITQEDATKNENNYKDKKFL